eukprot:TRINITY_DN1668_c0_g1_i5.p1 TRINITY_DN1668_c0_g1~~TRINITY_DN1668_c0_g1_i5.p1  ORF type:complete len:461 (-),score=88.30 TRINITY_DN1668_c0_g1_i5:84-1466(-)
MLHILASHGVDLTVGDKRGCNAFHLAVQNGHPVSSHYLYLRGLEIDSVDASGHTALHWAVYQGHDNLVWYLIRQGASLNKVDELGNTPLHWAAQRNNGSALMTLIHAGASVSVANKEGLTPVDIARKSNAKSLEYVLAHSYSLTPKGRVFYGRVWGALGVAMVPALALGMCHLPWYIVATGIAACLFVMCKWLRLSCPNIENQNPFWLCWFSSAWVVSAYLYFSTFFTWYSKVMGGFFIISNAIMVTLHVQMWWADPGILPKNTYTLKHIESCLDSQLDPGDMCPTCILRRPLRSKHCRGCGHCCVRMDHHCVWINNCVGQANNRRFHLLVVLFLMNHLWFLLQCSFYLYAKGRGEAGGIWWRSGVALYDHPLIAFCMIFHTFHFMWETMVLYSQVFLAKANLTTNETVNWPRYYWMHDSHGAMHNPFDKGSAWANLRDFYLRRTDYTACFHLPSEHVVV